MIECDFHEDLTMPWLSKSGAYGKIRKCPNVKWPNLKNEWKNAETSGVVKSDAKQKTHVEMNSKGTGVSIV